MLSELNRNVVQRDSSFTGDCTAAAFSGCCQ